MVAAPEPRSVSPFLRGEGWVRGFFQERSSRRVPLSRIVSEDAIRPLPASGRVVRGMIHYVAEHARLNLHEAGTFWLSRLRKGPGVRFSDSIFGKLLEPINRRQFQAVVDRLD